MLEVEVLPECFYVQITTLDEMLKFPGPETSSWAGELEGPQEVRSLLEVGTDSVDLVNKVFHANDPIFAQILLNDLVVCNGDTLLVDLPVTALVNQLTNSLQRWIAISNVGFDDLYMSV